MTEGSEQKKKRVKADSEVPRLASSVRSHLESLAGLKNEQVCAFLDILAHFLCRFSLWPLVDLASFLVLLFSCHYN